MVDAGVYGGGDPNDENYHDADYAQTLEEELSEILEAFYTMVSEEEMRKYQTFVEDVQNMKISKQAINAPEAAPDFELTDQDGETVNLKKLLEKGPVVLVFYRGKWCPQCNATIMRLQRNLEQIQAKGATLVAISPMLPDGTQVFSSKRSLQFPVLSDVGNKVARKFKITFTVPEEIRPEMIEWGEDLPKHNGDETWELPLPSTYVISRKGEIVWTYINEDPSNRAEPTDIVAAIPDDSSGEGSGSITTKGRNGSLKRGKRGYSRGNSMGNSLKLSSSMIRGSVRTLFKQKKQQPKMEPKQQPKMEPKKEPKEPKTKFGKKEQEAGEFLSHYM